MFTINGETWCIEFVPSNSEILRRSNGEYTLGATVDQYKTVFLADTLYGEKLRKVLCHELCHCLIFSMNLYFDSYQEERLADFIATYARDIINISDEIYKRIESTP
jgi:hypothetical protein